MRSDRRRFELLKRAYAEARYSNAYAVTAEHLASVLASVRHLRDVVEQASRERLVELREIAGLDT